MAFVRPLSFLPPPAPPFDSGKDAGAGELHSPPRACSLKGNGGGERKCLGDVFRRRLFARTAQGGTGRGGRGSARGRGRRPRALPPACRFLARACDWCRPRTWRTSNARPGKLAAEAAECPPASTPARARARPAKVRRWGEWGHPAAGRSGSRQRRKRLRETERRGGGGRDGRQAA